MDSQEAGRDEVRAADRPGPRPAKRPATRSAGRAPAARTPLEQSRLQRALTLFVLGATVLMAIGTVAVAVYIYQPELAALDLFQPLSLSEGLDGLREEGAGAPPPSGPAQGTPLGELLAGKVPLGTPEADENLPGGPTIEPGSPIQLTIEPLTEGGALEPLPT
ncbi:MAG TPA: hypothetical protein VF982_04775, partial [Anaerolineales bacterium]